MFDIGLEKITSLLIERSENDFKDFIKKLQPNHSEQKDLKQLVPKTPSKLSSYQPKKQQKELQTRKQKLLRQLQSINHQIEKTKMQKSRVQGRKKTEIDNQDPKVLNRAAELVARMNQKRKQASLNQQKNNQQMQLRIQHSLKKFNQLKQIKQKQKQQKRHQIENRIQKRKQKIQIMRQFSKRSNSLIRQLQSYRISLPNINHFKNPQQSESNKQTQTEKSKAKQLLPKTYPKSPFLQNVQKQEINKKRQQYLKSFQKKKIRERQQVYGKKVRKNLKQSSLFVTE